jgi:hypothetical protein
LCGVDQCKLQGSACGASKECCSQICQNGVCANSA